MPRLKATSFIGAPLRDCVPNSPIYNRTIKRAAAETAAVYDRLTGENAETQTIDHSGNGRGCPIKPVIVNNYMNKQLILTSVFAENVTVVACPVWIPTDISIGSGAIYVKAVFRGLFSGINNTGIFADADPVVQIYDSSMTLVTNQRMVIEQRQQDTQSHNADIVVFRTKSVVLGEGLHYFFINLICSQNFDRSIVSWHVDFDRSFSTASASIAATTNEEESSAHTTLTPSTFVDFYDGHFPENGGLDSYVLTRLNRNQGALWEYLTGAKIDGNENYKCETLRNHSRANFTNEPFIKFPICVQSVGASFDGKPIATPMTNLTPTAGMLGHARYPINQPSLASPSTFSINTLYMPSFNYLADRLRCSVIIANVDNSTALTNWRVRCVGIDTSGYASFTHLLSNRFYIATISGIAFDADSPNQMQLQIAHTSAGALSQSCVICGYAFYFV
jgi:hypothetical protein